MIFPFYGDCVVYIRTSHRNHTVQKLVSRRSLSNKEHNLKSQLHNPAMAKSMLGSSNHMEIKDLQLNTLIYLMKTQLQSLIFPLTQKGEYVLFKKNDFLPHVFM